MFSILAISLFALRDSLAMRLALVVEPCWQTEWPSLFGSIDKVIGPLTVETMLTPTNNSMTLGNRISLASKFWKKHQYDMGIWLTCDPQQPSRHPAGVSFGNQVGKTWSMASMRHSFDLDPLHVALHELGHVYGLKHNFTTSSVMNSRRIQHALYTTEDYIIVMKKWRSRCFNYRKGNFTTQLCY